MNWKNVNNFHLS